MIIYQTDHNDNISDKKEEYIQLYGLQFPKEIKISDEAVYTCVLKDNHASYMINDDCYITIDLQTLRVKLIICKMVVSQITINKNIKIITNDVVLAPISFCYGRFDIRLCEYIDPTSRFIDHINEPHIVFDRLDDELIMVHNPLLEINHSNGYGTLHPNGLYFSLNQVKNLNPVTESIKNKNMNLKKFFGNECNLMFNGYVLVTDLTPFTYKNKNFDFCVIKLSGTSIVYDLRILTHLFS
jgi:hypothetical protein